MKRGAAALVVFVLWDFVVLGCSHSVPTRADPLPTPVFPLVPTASFQQNEPVYSVALSASGRHLAIGGARKVTVWNGDEKKEIQTLRTDRDVLSLAFSPDEETLALGSYQTIELWNISRGERVAVLSGHAGYVTALNFSPDGRFLASGSRGEDPAIRLWDTQSGDLRKQLTYTTSYADTVRALAFSPDSRWLAAVGLDRQIRLWDLLSPDRPHRSISDPTATPLVLAFSPDRKMVIAGTAEGRLIFFDISTGTVGRTLAGHPGAIFALALTPDGTTLISAGGDKTLRRWEMGTGQMLETREMREDLLAAAMNRDGRYVAAIQPSGVSLFGTPEKKGIPPVVALLTPGDQMAVDKPSVRLTGKVVDDQGITEVRVRVNGMLQKGGLQGESRDLRVERAGSEKEAVFDMTIPLEPGLNEIAVTAFDLEGLSRTVSVRVTYRKEKGEVWAAVIGISRYAHVEGLRYADVDARAFYDYLVIENRIPPDHVTLLLNEEATLQRLRDVLGVELKKKARKQDTVILYYAGHGAPEPDQSSPDGDGLEKYLLPFDADPSRLYSTALPMTEISKIFSRLSAERVVLLQDTCYSGNSEIGGRTVQTAMFRASISDTFLNRLAEGKGRVIITASEANEVSLEQEALQHGVFTYYLLEAFKHGDMDGDGLITASEAFRYVSEKVPGATGQSQHPVKKGVETGEIILGRVRLGE